MTIAILYGGRSSEHEVSLVSATSVVRNIDLKKHQLVLIGITKDNHWFLQSEDELNRVLDDEKATLRIVEANDKAVHILPGNGKTSFSINGKQIPVDVVFPVMHGQFVEDGILQGLLESCEIPYVGCGVMASAVSMDKDFTKKIWEVNGLPVVPYVTYTKADISDSKKYDELFASTIEKFGFPLFVKPCNAGSSVGASKASNPKEFSMALMEAFMYDNKVLVEKAVNAKEVECSVTGNSVIDTTAASKVTAYNPGEVVPTHEFYDYEAKYNDPDGAALKIPADITEEQMTYVKETAVKAYEAVNASGLSRVDFFIDKDNGEIYINEINTLPGFTSISMFPKMCEASGLAYSSLIELVLEEAIERFKSKNALQTSK